VSLNPYIGNITLWIPSVYDRQWAERKREDMDTLSEWGRL